MNSVNMVGNLVGDAEDVASRSGAPGLKFRLAVNSRIRKGQGEKTVWEQITDYVDVVIYGATASNHREHLRKGAQISVSGYVRSFSRKVEGIEGYITLNYIYGETVSIIRYAQNHAQSRDAAVDIEPPTA